MGRGHEKRDVYRLAVDCVVWVYRKAGRLRPGFICLLGSTGSGAVNRYRFTAVGNGKSLFENTATQEILVVSKALDSM